MSGARLALAIGAYLAAGIVAAAYLAGIAYFVANRAVPEHIEIDTWLRYWDAYASEPVQRQRLLVAAAAAAGIVLAVPLAIIAALSKSGRSLHGDARWASRAEIRRAGLL